MLPWQNRLVMILEMVRQVAGIEGLWAKTEIDGSVWNVQN